MLHLSSTCTYYLYAAHTDMRKGFDGLCGIVQSQMSQNALSGSVFIFVNRRRTQLKLLLWEGDGFAIYYKRLEKGTYELPAVSSSSATAELDAGSYSSYYKGYRSEKWCTARG